ncbi:MAG: outer membrane lipoprotein-sorting protein [Treponema sp.]|jgi:outer membrane lipoprotein-sorting protein|nr:outer membrane lipoprotein-sorting protein [Treponema sp.]
MKKILFVLTVLAAFASPFFAQSVPLDQAKEILKKIDQGTGYYGTDFTGEYVLVQEKPGQGNSITSAIMYRRDSKAMCTIRITGPESDRGKGYVQFDKTIWFYDPSNKQFTFTAPKDKFQDTNVNNSDLRPQHYSDHYEIESAEYVALGKLDCVCLTLAVNKKSVNDVDYPKIKIWATKDDFLTRKREDYSLSGQLLRVSAIPSYQKIDGRSVPSKMVIQDRLRGQKINGKIKYESTQITVSNVSFQKLGDVVYSKQYLENMSL